jgi:hypothetical protein
MDSLGVVHWKFVLVLVLVLSFPKGGAANIFSSPA